MFSGEVGDTCFDIKKKEGSRVYPGQPGFGSTGFCQANSPAGFYLDPDRSQARVGRVLDRPVGPVRVSKLWLKYFEILVFQCNQIFLLKAFEIVQMKNLD